MNKGWNCPNCGKAHAPHVSTCHEPARHTFAPYDPRDYVEGFRPNSTRLCSCLPGTVCGNAACPHLSKSTCGFGISGMIGTGAK